tara:strand:+ start:15260 stop:15367 length:108 start_codon:yes stop_codon:yes gene_type:complete
MDENIIIPLPEEFEKKKLKNLQKFILRVMKRGAIL